MKYNMISINNKKALALRSLGEVGQSTLEYVLVFTVLIIIIIAFVKLTMKPSVEGAFNKLGCVIQNAADNF